jgi:hypothetical protein
MFGNNRLVSFVDFKNKGVVSKLVAGMPDTIRINTMMAKNGMSDDTLYLLGFLQPRFLSSRLTSLGFKLGDAVKVEFYLIRNMKRYKHLRSMFTQQTACSIESEQDLYAFAGMTADAQSTLHENKFSFEKLRKYLYMKTNNGDDTCFHEDMKAFGLLFGEALKLQMATYVLWNSKYDPTYQVTCNALLNPPSAARIATK